MTEAEWWGNGMGFAGTDGIGMGGREGGAGRTGGTGTAVVGTAGCWVGEGGGGDEACVVGVGAGIVDAGG